MMAVVVLNISGFQEVKVVGVVEDDGCEIIMVLWVVVKVSCGCSHCWSCGGSCVLVEEQEEQHIKGNQL